MTFKLLQTQINGYHFSVFMPLSWFIFGRVDLLSRGLPLSTTWMFSSFDRPLSSLQKQTKTREKINHAAFPSKKIGGCPKTVKLQTFYCLNLRKCWLILYFGKWTWTHNMKGWSQAGVDVLVKTELVTFWGGSSNWSIHWGFMPPETRIETVLYQAQAIPFQKKAHLLMYTEIKPGICTKRQK